ncbi:hypothetical protein Tco_0324981 [Tanacetum coccineum]
MLPYEGADPLNPSPPASDSESEIEFEEAAPMPPSPIPVDPEPKPESEAEASIIGTGRLVPLTRRRLITSPQVWIGSSSSAATGYDPEDLTPSHIKNYSENCITTTRGDLDHATWHYHHLRLWSFKVQKHLPPHLHNQVAPYVPPTAPVVLVAQDDPEDPYVAARDAVTIPAIVDDDPASHEETLPSEP